MRTMLMFRLPGLLATALLAFGCPSANREVRERAPAPTGVEDWRASEAAIAAERYDEALAIADRALADPAAGRASAARLFAVKGEAHWALWQFVEAERAWSRALAAAGPRELPGLLSRIARARRVVEEANALRSERRYRASPGFGPSSHLGGRVVVAYLFLTDARSGPWGLRNRSEALATWSRVERWLTAEAGRRGRELSFTRRIFHVSRNPAIRRLRVRPGDPSERAAHAAVELAVRQLGAPGILAFTERLRAEEGAGQAVLVAHVNGGERSFAVRCLAACGEPGEFAFLEERIEPRGWQELEHAQAHETLHLFGADDLYRIAGAEAFAVRDVMNYPARYLKNSRIESLTAWAVGLSDRRPDAPFEIVGP